MSAVNLTELYGCCTVYSTGMLFYAGCTALSSRTQYSPVSQLCHTRSNQWVSVLTCRRVEPNWVNTT